MAFIKVPGLLGRVYVPEARPGKKHPCRDCFACEFCSDDRCRVCRRTKPTRPGGYNCNREPECGIGGDDIKKENGGKS